MTRLSEIYENKERLDALHQKMWNVVDLITTLDLKPSLKELLSMADRISV